MVNNIMTTADNTAPKVIATEILLKGEGIIFGSIHLENSLPMVAPGGDMKIITKRGMIVPKAVNNPAKRLACV